MAHHLITGGAGFLGSNLAHRLIDEGHKVTVFDRFSRGKQERVPSGARAWKGDIRDVHEVCDAVWHGLPDVVWHLAYVQGTQTFYADPKQVIEVALLGIMNILTACERRTDPPEFFLVSSSEVYQDPPSYPTDESVPLVVPDVTNSRYSYGGGKIASEVATMAYKDKLRRAVIVRPHNIYGPDMGYEHVIPEFAKRMMDLQHTLTSPYDGALLPFEIQGSGEETRSFCYISDCIDGFMALYEKGEHGEVYHLGNPSQERSIANVAHAVADFFDDEIELVPGRLPQGSPTRRLPDISKMQVLGFEPKVTLEEGLLETLAWYMRADGRYPTAIGAGDERTTG